MATLPYEADVIAFQAFVAFYDGQDLAALLQQPEGKLRDVGSREYIRRVVRQDLVLTFMLSSTRVRPVCP